ncbi:hypothetical protein LINPERPRIM_LOCUS11779 [Linum perenne]
MGYSGEILCSKGTEQLAQTW